MYLLSIHVSNYSFKNNLLEIYYCGSFLFESPARSLIYFISRSDKAGKLLAEVLQKGLQGNRLVGGIKVDFMVYSILNSAKS